MLCITVEPKSSCINFFFIYCKNSGYFEHVWPLSWKAICRIPICRKVIFIMQKINFIPHFIFLKKIANLLLWVPWKFLIIPINDDSITLKKTLMPKMLKSICGKLVKLNFISNLFFEILYRHCKLSIFGILGMLDHPHQNPSNEFEGRFHVYMHAENRLLYLVLSKDIAKK